MRVKMSKKNPPAPTTSAVGPCPTEIQIVGRPGTGSLPSTIAPPDHPFSKINSFTKLDNILSNNRNLTVVNLSVFFGTPIILETCGSHLIFCDKLFFPLNSGEKLEHSNNWKR